MPEEDLSDGEVGERFCLLGTAWWTLTETALTPTLKLWTELQGPSVIHIYRTRIPYGPYISVKSGTSIIRVYQSGRGIARGLHRAPDLGPQPRSSLHEGFVSGVCGDWPDVRGFSSSHYSGRVPATMLDFRTAVGFAFGGDGGSDSGRQAHSSMQLERSHALPRLTWPQLSAFFFKSLYLGPEKRSSITS